MAKLVVLNEGLTGTVFELSSDKTTIGRVPDNNFPIAVASVSSHHAEILLRGNEVVVKDLNSTNGTFINGQQVTTEAVLKPGQVLRLGQVEIRLDVPGAPAPAAAAASPAPAPVAPMKKAAASTMVINKGVSLEQLEQGPQSGFDTSKGGFTKKSNKTNLYFIIGGIVFALVIGGLIVYLLIKLKSGSQ